MSSADAAATAAMTSTIPPASDTQFPSQPEHADNAPPQQPANTQLTSSRKVRKRKRNNTNSHHHHGHHHQQQQQQHQHHHHGNALAHLNGKKWIKQRLQHQTKQQHQQQQLLQKQQQHNNNNNNHKPDSENIPSTATCPPKNSNANGCGGRNKSSGPKGLYKAIVHRNGGLNLIASGAVIGVNVAAPIVAAPLLPPGAKFYLPNEKRLRKELIVPPTKFLLGGNISDPLNLNSLQDEALNASMNAATPKSSPITTPPKIDVLNPPNMFDPLHLLDVQDADKYEKLLTSPLKQRGKAKHRNRKKKALAAAAAVAAAAAAKKAGLEVGAVDEKTTSVSCEVTDDENCSVMDDCSSVASSSKRNSLDMSAATAALSSEARDRCTRELKLDLTMEHSNTPLTGRKRKTSESSSVLGGNSTHKRSRRLDSMDKIVSPVIPQPGAWKRPPLVLPMGAPRNRVRNTSVSIADAALDGDVQTPVNEAAPSIGAAADNTAGVAADGQAKMTPTAMSLLAVAPTHAPTAMPAQQQQQQQTQTIAKLPATAKYQYGNYNRYVGFNSLDEFSDVRLKIFSRHAFLFRGKDLLDIGCNVGHMTVAVARKLQPKSIVGVDIDATLISRARHNLKLYVKLPADALTDATVSARRPSKNQQRKRKHQHQPQQQRRTNSNKDNYYPISMPICFGPMPLVTGSVDADASTSAKTPSAQPDTVTDSATGVTTTVKSPSSVELTQFPHNIYFRTMNYAQQPGDEPVVEAQQFDLILCLSVTKWLHLNYGDVGLKAAFRRMFNQLRPGGKLVLEAQNWASYKNKKRLTQTIADNYRTIEFFPNSFHEYLLSPEVGFSHSYTLGIARHARKGFRRPVQLYIKGDFTPSQVCWSDNYHAETPYHQYPESNYVDLRRPPPFYSSWHQVEGFGRIPTNQGGYGSNSARGDGNGGGGSGGGGSGSYTPYHPLGPGSARAPNSGASNTTPYGRTPLNGMSYTSQYYNPLETDSYLPSYDNEVQTRHYCFASPLYSTVWSPPSSLAAGPSWSSGNSNNNQHRGGGGGGSGGNSVGRRSASTTPLFGSIRKVDGDDSVGGPGGGRGHVYFNNMAGGGVSGRDSQRSVDECSRSPQMQMYMYSAANTPRSGSCSAREAGDGTGCGASPREHVYADVVGADSGQGGGGGRGGGGSGIGGENSSSPIRQYSGESSRSVDEEEVLPQGPEGARE